MTPELSPLGDSREHRVPCARCGVLTFNFSCVCSACLDDARWDDHDGEALEPWRSWEHEPDIAADRHVERGGA